MQRSPCGRRAPVRAAGVVLHCASPGGISRSLLGAAASWGMRCACRHDAEGSFPQRATPAALDCRPPAGPKLPHGGLPFLGLCVLLVPQADRAVEAQDFSSIVTCVHEDLLPMVVVVDGVNRRQSAVRIRQRSSTPSSRASAQACRSPRSSSTALRGGECQGEHRLSSRTTVCEPMATCWVAAKPSCAATRAASRA